MEHVSSIRPTGKFPEKVENLKRLSRFPGWNFRTECRVPFTFLVLCTSSRSTVGHRYVPGFTTKWNNFLPIGNSTFAPTEISGFFFLNGKRPMLARCHHILNIFYIVTLFNNCVILVTLCFTLWHAQAVSKYFPMTVNWPIKTQSTKNTWYPLVVLYPTTINRPTERVCNMRNMCVSWSFFK